MDLGGADVDVGAEGDGDGTQGVREQGVRDPEAVAPVVGRGQAPVGGLGLAPVGEDTGAASRSRRKVRESSEDWRRAPRRDGSLESPPSVQRRPVVPAGPHGRAAA